MDKRVIAWLLCLFPVVASVNSVCGKGGVNVPSQRPIELREFTTLSVDLVPDLGTRLIFPFILNDDSSILPFDIKVTNESIFHSIRSVNQSHNTVLLTVNTDSYLQSVQGGARDFIGSAFVTAAGYNVTIRLRTTTDKRKHCDDIIFDISDERREYLIDHAVKARLAEYDRQYEDKLSKLDQMADSQSRAELGNLALQRPKKHSIKEDIKSDFERGGTLGIYLREFLEYDTTNILTFELTNRSANTINVLGVDIFKTKKGEILSHFDSASFCERTLHSNTTKECALVIDHRDVLSARELTVKVSSDQGEVNFTW